MPRKRATATPDIPRYQQVVETLLNEFHAGKYDAGQKLPSEAALVRRFETSRITVGRALRELKQRGLITGVAGSGNFVKATALPESLLFGLLIPNLGETEIFEPICRGMATAPEAGSYGLLWGHSAEPENLEAQALELCQQYIARKVAGVFFAPLEWSANKDRVNAEICTRLDAARIPLVLLDRYPRAFPNRSPYDLVGIDNRRAGFLAAEHLLDRGCLDVAFIALSGAAPTVEARIAGYREALIQREIALQKNRIQRSAAISPEFVAEALRLSGSRAFVCANDQVAGSFLHALQTLGLAVPGDIRVVGIDDVEYARLLPIPLTTVHQPCRAIGQAAITAMLTRRERPSMPPREILLDCHLMVRQSS